MPYSYKLRLKIIETPLEIRIVIKMGRKRVIELVVSIMIKAREYVSLV